MEMWVNLDGKRVPGFSPTSVHPSHHPRGEFVYCEGKEHTESGRLGCAVLKTQVDVLNDSFFIVNDDNIYTTECPSNQYMAAVTIKREGLIQRNPGI